MGPWESTKVGTPEPMYLEFQAQVAILYILFPLERNILTPEILYRRLSVCFTYQLRWITHKNQISLPAIYQKVSFNGCGPVCTHDNLILVVKATITVWIPGTGLVQGLGVPARGQAIGQALLPQTYPSSYVVVRLAGKEICSTNPQAKSITPTWNKRENL